MAPITLRETKRKKTGVALLTSGQPLSCRQSQQSRKRVGILLPFQALNPNKLVNGQLIF